MAVSLLLSACGPGTPPAPAAAPPPNVVAVRLETKPVSETTEFVGRVVAAERVELRARVRGFLKERRFQEGQEVRAGDVLFLIEPDQYQAVVEQREADLARAQADERNAEAQLRRGEELLKTANIPASKVDELRAAAGVARAGVAQARAALTAAQLDLSYTQISAPIGGRIGLAKLTVGTLVDEGSGALATIVKRDPVQLLFPVAQRQLLAHRQRVLAQGGDPARASVRAKLADGSLYPHPGQLDFIDVTADSGTDTVRVRAEFPNPDGLLVDGQYVGVLVESGQPESAILIPQSALQLDQQGAYVLVVDGERRAQARRIATGQVKGAEILVKTGLQEGDLVITEGIQKVRPGQLVSTAPPRQAEALGP